MDWLWWYLVIVRKGTKCDYLPAEEIYSETWKFSYPGLRKQTWSEGDKMQDIWDFTKPEQQSEPSVNNMQL